MILSSGALILVSLIVYVSWTVISMFQLGRRNMEAIASFAEGVEGFEERIHAVEIAGQQRSRSMLKFWRPVVFTSGLTGFAAAVVLGGAAVFAILPKAITKPSDPLAVAIQRANAAAVKAECHARVAATYAIADSRKTATNEKTGQQTVLINGRWMVVPRCDS